MANKPSARATSKRPAKAAKDGLLLRALKVLWAIVAGAFRGSWRGVRIAIKTVALALLAAVLLTAAFAAAFFAIPRLELNSERLAWLADKSRAFGVGLSWDDAVFSLERTHWHSKAVRFQANGLCATWMPPALDACFGRIDLGFEIGLKNESTGEWFDVPTQVFPIVALDGRIRVDLNAFPQHEPREEKPGGFSVVDFLRTKILPRWDAGGSRIELASLAVDSGQKRFRASAELSTEGPAGQPPEAMRLRLSKFVDQATGYPNASGALTVRWPDGSSSSDGARPWVARLEFLARLSRARSADVRADARARAWSDVDYAIAAKFKGFSPLQNLRLAGLYKDDRVTGKASMKAGSYGRAISAASAVDCGYDVQLRDKVAALQCGPETVRIAIREGIAPQSLREKRSLFVLRPTFEFKASNVTFGERLGADLALSLRLASANLLTLEAEASAKVGEGPAGAHGDAAPKKTSLRWSASAQTNFDLPEFRKLTEFLSGTPFAVPAPLNGLSGPIRAKVDAQVDQDGGRAPFELTTRLASIDQRAFLTLDGVAAMANHPERGWLTQVRLRVRADDLKISAPRFSFKAPPQMAPDGRFKSFQSELERKDDGPSGFSFVLDLETALPGSIQIATNATSAPIPLSLDLSARSSPPSRVGGRGPAGELQAGEGSVSGASTPAPDEAALAERRRPADPRAAAVGSMVDRPPVALRGSVVVGQTPIRFMRRNALVEGMRIDFLPDGRRRLDGRLSVDYPDYDIRVFVTGFAEAPHLRFESQPPLPQDQILAALLFGRPINQLSADERSSAANMNAAIADAALSLSSLYILADTPVEGVGYDAERGLVTARVGLGGGNSLELGSGAGGAAEVGVRRKLSRDLVFNTYVERVGQTETKAVRAFLEWVKKF